MKSIQNYGNLLSSISGLLEGARRQSARAVNIILTAVYWEIGRRIVEFEQQGKDKAEYGEEIIEQLSLDLTKRFGRGFSRSNLFQIRLFYLCYRKKVQTLSGQFQRAGGATKKIQTVSGQLNGLFVEKMTKIFPLSWSQYARLLSVEDENSRKFYEEEAIHGGWSVRQLDRQISTLFYERTLLSKNKAVMLKKGMAVRSEDIVSAEQEIKDPTILEFLNLKDEYSETELEEALIHRLEDFLLEMGQGFTFVARQKRIKVGNAWYRIDLLLYHRKLRCLVVIDLKVGNFTHADAGQMNLYLNYVAENMTLPEENPPVGIILCAEKDDTVAHYAMGGLTNKMLASRYKLQLPDKKKLESQIEKAQQEFQRLQHRKSFPV
jgi:predicted nuclease of restriction endonuclease-like (RecB) superfamily